MPNIKQKEDPQMPKQEKTSLRQVMALLPRPLMTEVLKRFLTALLVLVLTIVVLFVTKDYAACAGFLLSLVAVYLGLDILWKFGDGKIVVARMVVCKASTGLKNRDRVHVILRDASITDLVGANYETFKYDLTVAARDRGNITSGTILDIYISEASPSSVLAYEILGELSNR